MDQVEFLALCGSDPMVPDQFPPSVEQLLKAPKALRGLCIDMGLLALSGCDLILRSCSQILSGIKELELTPRGREHKRYEPKITRCLHVLFLAARSLTVTKVDENCCDLWYPPNQGLLVKLLNRNQAHLQVIQLPCGWIFDPSFKINDPLVFPALKKLEIQAHGIAAVTMRVFLQAHPSLQHLQLRFPAEVPKTEFLEQLAPLLKAVREKCEGLKGLSVIIYYPPVTLEMRDVLLSLASLKLDTFELSLGRQFSAIDDDVPVSTASFLSSFTSSLCCIHLEVHSQLQNPPISSANFTKIDPLKLNELCLKGLNSGVTDETAEFICRNFKQLQKLDLSQSECTDYGFTGIQPGSSAASEESEFSLAGLKGLKFLGLNSCKNMTDKTLMFGIRFTELIHIELHGNEQLTGPAYVQMLRQNPSLEFMNVQWGDIEGIPDDVRLYDIAPRLKWYCNCGECEW